MLCRALLAVLAVTCTFPPLALAIAQGTELVQLKDLVCVLWFSGLKKEDMDVNLLTKLQRHNINIDSKNETMLKECSMNNAVLTSQTEKLVYVTTTSTASPTTIEHSSFTNAVPKNQDLDSIIKYITELQKSSQRNFKNARYGETSTLPNVQSEHTDLFESRDRYRNLPSERSTTKIAEPNQENFQSKIQNVLNFWQTLATKRTTQKIERTTERAAQDISQKYKQQISLPRSFNSSPYYSGKPQFNQGPGVEQWLAEFLSKKNRMPITTSTPRNIPSDLGEMILPFYKDLIHSYDSHQNIQDMVNSQVSKDILNKFITGREGSHTFDKNVSAFKSNGDNSKTNEQYNNPFKFGMFPKNVNTENVAISEGNKMDISHDLPNEQFKRKNVLKNEDENQIPNKTIQEIADSVKAMILKELGHVIDVTTIATTTVSPLPPTLYTTSTNSTLTQDLLTTSTIKPDNWTGNVNQVMNKIMDLYERVKAISDKVNTSKEVKNPIVKSPYQKQERSGALNKETFADTLQQNMFNRMANVKHILMNPFRDLTRQEIQKLPSIIQTNSGEIAPLLVPMANPLKIVNQILVVSTAKPTNKIESNGKSKSRYEELIEDLYKNRAHTSFERQISQKTVVPNILDYKKLSHLGNFDINHYYKNIPKKYDINHGDLFGPSHNYRTRNTDGTNEKLKRYNNNDNKENREHINYFDYISNSRLEKIPTYRNSEKLHERLESENGRMGGNQQIFGRNEDNFGHKDIFRNEDNLGHIKDNFGYNKDYFGHNKDNFGHDKDNFAYNRDNFEHNKDNFGQKRDNFGQNRDNFGHNKDNFGHDKDNFAYNRDNFEHNKDNFGQKRDNFGQNRDNFGHNKDNFGQNRDNFGHNKDNFGQNKDILAIARESENDKHIASRQQKPLNMKNTPYDDTHFRNFLKTQEKVNDMLEKILETKNSLPYSVETA